jgi:myosin heavy subunit
MKNYNNFFNYHIILSEQEEYIKESVFWTPLSIPDNMECIDMIENSNKGFFILLDSACAAPKPDPIAFIQELFKNHDKNKTLRRANQPGSGNARGAPKNKPKKGAQREKFDGFLVDHFADHVTYDAQNFLVKNMEAVHPDTAKMLALSKTAIIQQLAEEKGKKKKTIHCNWYIS